MSKTPVGLAFRIENVCECVAYFIRCNYGGLLGMNNQYLFADHIADGIYNIECEISSLFVDVVAVAYYRNLMAFRRLFFM